MKKEDKIKQLCDRVRELEESSENKRKKELWSGLAGLQNVFTRWLPKPGLSVVPFIADLDRELWVQVLKLNIEEIYDEPLSYLEFELMKKIYAFENFEDDLPITKIVTIWHGVGYLQTLFGLEQEPAYNGHEPWVGKHPIINEKQDLDRIVIPDFYKSGIQPEIHRIYSQMRENLDEDFSVIFPEFDFGCYGIALSLRGVEKLSYDMIDDPDFVHRLMTFIYDSKIHFSTERAKFLHTQIATLYTPNDDISVPVISPNGYRDYILPHEIKISEFHGGIDYWHSCGKVDSVLEFIKKIPNVKMIHISYANDFKKAVDIIGNDHIIEFVLNPIDDVLKATPEQMESRLLEIESICEGAHYTVRADAFQNLTTLEKDIEMVKLWIKICRSIMGGK